MSSLCATPLIPDIRYGELSVDGNSLHKPWWNITDLSELFSSGSSRGSNPLVETLAGRPAAPILEDQIECSFPLVFSGALDPNGDPYTNPFEGLHRNRHLLHAAIIEPFSTGTAATLDATLSLPGLATPLPFQIQTIEFFGWTFLPKGLARTVLRAIIPDPSPLHDPYSMASSS